MKKRPKTLPALIAIALVTCATPGCGTQDQNQPPPAPSGSLQGTAGPTAPPTASPAAPAAPASPGSPTAAASAVPVVNTPPDPADQPPIQVTYQPGEQWVYDDKVTAGATTTDATLTFAVATFDGTDATIDVTNQVGTATPQSQAYVFATGGVTPFSFTGISSPTASKVQSMTQEAITVPAGTFKATKTTITNTSTTGTNDETVTIVRWTAPGVGLIKQTTTQTITPASSGGKTTQAAPTVTTATVVLQSHH